MFYRSSPVAPTRRSGVVLLVVMAMLALFASLALSFVFYADSEAQSSNYSVAAQTNSVPDIDTEVLLGYWLSKFIYGDNDPNSAGRGWDLARSMYGYNPAGLNFTPYNGAGRSSLATTAPLTAPKFGGTTVDYPRLINYQQFTGVANPAMLDPLLNQVRAPGFYGKQSDGPTYRFIGGANPPWTAYDINNLFLAEMTADGTVLLPSFSRPWNALGTAGTAAARYTSLFIDPTWNSAFSAPDTDASGNQVKNLDFGPGMNDSNWMDWGFPIMTAPDGKRYKPLFAPLVVDLSNRLHLWAHGNNLGTLQAGGQLSVSNQGFGAPEVNLTMLPGMSITSAAEKKSGVVTITTAVPHTLQKNQYVIIRNMPAAFAGYNGMYQVTATPSATTFTYTDTTKGLAAYTGTPFGPATVLSVSEMQSLYNLRYGGASPGNLAAFPPSWVPPMSAKGTWFSMVNASALDATAGDATVGMSSTSPYLWFQTTTIAAVTPGVLPVKFVPYAGGSPFPWAIEAGMIVTIDGGTANQELVQVAKVNYAVSPPTFTPTPKTPFTKKHATGAPITAGFPGFPTFSGWGNTTGELTPNPLAFNLYLPNAPSMASHQEALLRWSGTNGPASTSEIFRLMPTTFSNMRARNMVTPVNWGLDRVTSAPYLNFNRNSAATQEYSLVSGMSYPVVGNNEIQTVVVTGPINGTFALQLPGQKQTVAITLTANLKNTIIRKDLKTTLPVGGTATVSAVTINNTVTPPIYSFTVAFGGTLSNLDVPQLTGVGLTGTPLPTVKVTTTKNGSNLFSTPNFAAVPIQTPTANSDYAADWRSAVSQALRVDLTRTLREYPAPAASGLITNTAAGSPFDLAQKDRQQFAKDIYNALIRVTGARDPNANAGMQPTAPDYQAARWLAQLAVNIVDYIDDDDYMTPFNWYATEYLFGTELPRLVLNEAYIQMEAQTLPGQTPVVPVVPGQVNVWAELFNPFKATPAGSTYPIDGGTALLQQTGNTPYVIELYKSNPALTGILSSPNNPTGSALPTLPQNTQNNWGAIPTNLTTQQVLPANGGSKGGTIKIWPIALAKGATESAKGVVTITVQGGHTLQVGPKSQDIGKAITINNVQTLGYDGTFLITGVPSPTTFTYAPATSGMAPAGGGTATFVVTDSAAGNNGFYVVGPANAQYSDPSRPPNLPATYASAGMSFAPAIAIINTAAKNGAMNAGTTVTIQGKSPLAADFAVGASVVIQGVTTTNAAKAIVPATGYNNGATNPAWIITGVTPAVNPTSFTFTVPAGTVFPTTPSGGGTATVVPTGVTLLLRRLANQHLAPNPPAGSSTVNPKLPYNPYITVDYLDGVPVSAAAPALNRSLGRTQPYAAATAFTPQLPTAAPLPNAPANTFFNQNNPNVPFDWLVHLDRPPVNPIELLHVSGYRPHELTQQFVTANGKFQHYAPWNPFAFSGATPTGTMADPNSLIYRVLDQMSTRYMAGMYTGGRTPGNINLNTITEVEVFQALCDAHDATAQYPNAWFTQADVQAVFQKLITSRNAGNASLQPTSEGTPFKSFSAASTVTLASGNQAVSMYDTLFRTDPATGRPLFIPPSAVGNLNAHPYLQSALLQKIYNNITTTSNTFAVWWTVGFFEVVDESVKPARLGQEIGRAQNRHIRHRFFAIVDRSGMHLFDGTAGAVTAGQNKTLTLASLNSMGNNAAVWNATQSYLAGNIVTSGGSAYFCTQTPPVGTATTNTAYWQPLLQPGMLLNIDSNTPNAEVVTVQSVTGMSITANFVNSHVAGASVFLRGNPGPRAIYNPHDDRGVVLHMSVIK